MSMLKNPVKILMAIGILYRNSLKFRLGFTLVLILSILSFTFPAFSPYDTRARYVVPKDEPPSSEHLLGTSTMGRDIFWELWASTKNSLIIGLIAALIASHTGLLLGLIAGIRGGWIERIIMFLSDTVIAIPGFILLTLIIMILKSMITALLIGVLVSLIAWAWPARQVRSIALSLRERTFMITSRFSGEGFGKTIIYELMPHVVGWHLVNFTNTILSAIALEAGLAIFGLSILGENTLGVMIYWAQNYAALYRGIWWWITAPVIVLILIFVSFYLVSISISEYLQRVQRLYR